VLKELENNLCFNCCEDQVVVRKICLGDTTGSVTFYGSEDHSWNATLIEAFAKHHNEGIEMTVPSVRLDDEVARTRPPTVIKLDVEGAEHLVLAGGQDFLRNADVPIVAEYNIVALREAQLSPSEYLGLYQDLGYEYYLMRRPLVGFHRWNTLYKPRLDELPGLCNLVMLKHAP
jgi:FkbM family methyltransferase